MFFYHRAKHRPVHLGHYPLEILPRQPQETLPEIIRSIEDHIGQPTQANTTLNRVLEHYQSIYEPFVDGDVAEHEAPVPDDLDRRSQEIKGSLYFLDASQVGICELTTHDINRGQSDQNALAGHTRAIVILTEHPRLPETDNLAHQWTAQCERAVADLRATELATTVAGHIRNMGFNARAHTINDGLVNQTTLAIRAGLLVSTPNELTNPFLGLDFSISVITTTYRLAVDQPLALQATKAGKGLRYWWGINGARSGRERGRQAKRASHLSRYPMETVKRVDKPTTLILDDEVPRVPKRANFFVRAAHGDLGDKAQREVKRFAYKTPLSVSMRQLILAQVPHQGGDVNPQQTELNDPQANAKALKSLGYFLGADLVGICEVPRYAWYSHHLNGKSIQPYHRYAIVMLIDQGFDTMEGASGDDWMSGGQSMRGYLRGAQIAGIMAQLLRDTGHSARAQTNADSDVLQIPLILQAGLGELSRIGELVLNPFVGPRFKSVVLTTDLPLEVDRPIDFGLQTFCNHCLKCARECPVDAIPFGPKVMFNGYEIWKPDVERCTRYRVTNQKGSACGRCMKTCPINKVVDTDGAWLARTASWLGVNAMWLKPVMVPIATWVDDALGNGRINPVKKWWFNHEMVDGRTVEAKATNERNLDLKRKIDPAKHKVAYYHAKDMPEPESPDPVSVNRKEAQKAAMLVESPDVARQRKQAGGAIPVHYSAHK